MNKLMALPSSSINQLASEVFERIRAYAPEESLMRIKEAYEFAKQAHQGQLRKSGEPYISHPIRTVQILTNLRVDEDTLIAAFLHDVPEDTQISLPQIEEKFGKKIAYLVDGITKLTKVHYRERMSGDARQIESLKKLFIHSAEDLRVILIKLADRLDNMRTLRFIAEERKRGRIARETLEVYVPIANLLGIGEIRMELEDLCFEYLYPMDFTNLKRELEENMEERNFILEEMIHLTEKELQKHRMDAEIVGRPKTLWSIFRKLQLKKSLTGIDDIIAIRVIVPTRQDCYQVLGLIHRLFKPKPGALKDYIAVPKPNGYQSIHTTVFGINSSIVEFQIRTRYMHLEAEYGVAAHYFYKYSDEQELANIMRQRSSWVQRILELQKDQKDPQEFMEDLKIDIFQDRIFVFSPKGDVIDLPRGACAVDFAYAIHTEIGNHSAKAEINGIISAVTMTLASGDTVRIIIDRNQKPEREWLHFAKTALAANKIREFLKKEPFEKKYMVGKRFLQKEFDRIGKNFLDELSPKRIKLLTQKLPYRNLDEILVAVGEGSIEPREILNVLYEENELAAGRFLVRKKSERKPAFLSRISLRILGRNDKNEFREILRTLNALHVPIVKFIVDRPWYFGGLDRCRISVLVKEYSELAQIFESLEQLDGVKKITRLFLWRKIWFFAVSGLTGLIWLSHPFIINLLLVYEPFASQIILNALIYGGLILLFALVFYLKRMTRRSFPELEEMAYYWPLLYALNTLALFTVIGEIITFSLHFNWIFALGFIVGVYALLTSSYISYRKEQFS